MALPSQLFQGDSVAWVDLQVPTDATAATAYLRTNTAGAGVVIEGTEAAGIWTFTLSAEDTGAMVPGDWAVQFQATLPSGPYTYRPLGRLRVIQGLIFAGEPSPLDPRSATEIELAELRVAIRSVYRSASYKIGTATGSRELKRADLPALLDRERVLLRRIASEARAARGGAGRRVLTQFVDT